MEKNHWIDTVVYIIYWYAFFVYKKTRFIVVYPCEDFSCSLSLSLFSSHTLLSVERDLLRFRVVDLCHKPNSLIYHSSISK